MILLSNFKLLLSFTIQNSYLFLIKLKIKMQETPRDYELCMKEALDNAKKRINILDNYDKKSVLAEYKEWIRDGLNKHSVLLLREDPII